MQRGRGALFRDQQPDDHFGHLPNRDALGRDGGNSDRPLYQLDLTGQPRFILRTLCHRGGSVRIETGVHSSFQQVTS
jgi:hypothetical protein